ncbi:hypothetical protein, partial [Ferruginibacter sp.]|uniref:hypothetical protein n=1 Tax=Ferruginibacter sp. TaxID=1940288 RepID=UPI002658590C
RSRFPDYGLLFQKGERNKKIYRRHCKNLSINFLPANLVGKEKCLDFYIITIKMLPIEDVLNNKT